MRSPSSAGPTALCIPLGAPAAGLIRHDGRCQTSQQKGLRVRDDRGLPFEVSHWGILRIALPMMSPISRRPSLGLWPRGRRSNGRCRSHRRRGISLCYLRRGVRVLQLPARGDHGLHRPGGGCRRPHGGTEHAARGFGIAVTVGLTLVLMRVTDRVSGLDVLAASGPVAEAAGVFLRSGSGRHRLFCLTMSRSVGSSTRRSLLGLMLQTLLNGLGIILSLWWVLHLDGRARGCSRASLRVSLLPSLVLAL